MKNKLSKTLEMLTSALAESLKVGIYNKTEKSGGVQVGLHNVADESRGVQVGAGNVADESRGVQVGMHNVADESRGVQVGAGNLVFKELNGFQIGAVCYANDGNYAQLGLVTIRGKGPWYTRVTPIFGFHTQKDKE